MILHRLALVFVVPEPIENKSLQKISGLL